MNVFRLAINYSDISRTTFGAFDLFFLAPITEGKVDADGKHDHNQ